MPNESEGQGTEKHSALGRLVREPLVHFVVLGAVIFAVNAVANPTSPDTSRTIIVSRGLVEDFKRQVDEDGNRVPTPVELQKIIDTWVLNEIMFREGIALGLDKGDEMIRERVIHKLRLLVYGDLKIPPATEEDLRAWFDKNRARFDKPQTFDFFEVSIEGTDAEAQAKAFLAQIEQEAEPEDLRNRTKVFRGRNRPSLAAVFGADFPDRLAALPRGQWQIVQSGKGWHIVRVDNVVEPIPADIDNVRDQILVEWKDEQTRRLGLAAIQKLGGSYDIRREDLRP